jgi:DNA-binding transcriptional LysR family regulator
MNLTLRQLRAFSTVAELGSFTEAAKRLHLTQAAISVLVRELEAELAVRLFDRSTRRVQLSDAGREFLPSVLRVLNELGEGVANVSNLRDKRKGTVRVAAAQLMACTLMPRVIAGYQERYPDVEVKLVDTLPEMTLERLVGGDVELAIGPDSMAVPEINRLTLLRDRHHLICPPGHPLASRKRVKWSDVSCYPFIAPTRDFMRRLAPELALASPETELAPVHEVSYMTTALGMVAGGLGVTACPTYSASLVRAYGLEMRSLVQPEFYRDVCLYSLANKSLSPASESFYDFLREFVPQTMELGGRHVDTSWTA